MDENTPERKGGVRSAADWREVMRNRKGDGKRIPGVRSAADWGEVMRNRAVTEVTTMTLPNTAEPHTAATDAELLENARRNAPRLKKILAQVMADIDAEKY